MHGLNEKVNADTSLTWGDLGVILEDVNKIRIALGIGEGKLPELPAGIKGDPRMCVLAKALSNGWEIEVESELRFTHPEYFSKPFDWMKAVDALNDMGFNAHYDSGECEVDCYCGDSCCSGTEMVQEGDEQITIALTSQMDDLIRDFDKGYLPFLVLDAD